MSAAERCPREGQSYLGRFTRDDWRLVPIDRVLVPTLNAPVLAFAPADVPWSEVIKADLTAIAELFVRRGCSLEAFAASPKGRGMLLRAERLHIQRVELAIGFRWPLDPPGFTEFPI